MKSVIRLIACCSAVMILISGLYVSAEKPAYLQDDYVQGNSVKKTIVYSEYKEKYADVGSGNEISVDCSVVSGLKNAEIADNVISSGKRAVVIQDNGSATWTVNVPSDALYNIYFEYAAAEHGSGDIELGFSIDGKAPFDEVEYIALKRKYELPEEEFKVNTSGNEVANDSVEVLEFAQSIVNDISGYETEPFMFYFAAGTHTITLDGSRGVPAISKIILKQEEKPLSYKEYKKSNKASDNSKEEPIVLEGEHFNFANTIVITPKTDHSSPITSPQSATNTVLNTVGGGSWKMVGEKVTWKFNVPSEGLYKITLRARQNQVDGRYTTRKLYIDGKVPFSEVSAIDVKYSTDWQVITLGDGKEDFEFYLSEGDHELTLEAVSGSISENVGEVKNILNEFYRIYRRIVMITGTAPDINRDYSLDTIIPEELKELGVYADRLNDIVELIDKEAGKNGSYTATLKKTIAKAKVMSDDADAVAKNLDQFKSNLGAVSSWLLTAIEQPLEIDLIELAPASQETSVKGKAGFFKSIAFSVQGFISTFTQNYTSIGSYNKNGKTIEVWISTGRDQAEIMRGLINSDYSKKYDCNIRLSIVSGGLLSSILAGKAPDVVFNNGQGIPFDYALRGAVYDLSSFPDFDEVAKRFSEAALIPPTLDGKVYGLPQTFSFPMFFYRTDMFEEYGYQVPKTWTDVISLIHSLQSDGLEFGLPKSASTYAMMLSQRGEPMYKDGNTKTNLDSNVAVSTFVDYTDFYSLYDLSVSYDFSNRFRSGEMPCAISDFGVYNQLTAFAPEIKGRWKMVPVPGVEKEDGSIDNTTIGSTTYIIMIADSDVKEEAWEFMKWYMSEDVQGIYGTKMESLLGSCAKVSTANINALAKMTWSSSEYENIFKQYENVTAIPSVPGGYYTDYAFNFAFSRVYNGSTLQNMGEDPATVLTEYVPKINDEIKRKREEFGR